MRDFFVFDVFIKIKNNSKAAIPDIIKLFQIAVAITMSPV